MHMCISTPQHEEQLKLLSESVQQANIKNLILVGDLNDKSLEWNNNTVDRHGELIEEMLTQNKLLVHNDEQPTRKGGQSVIDIIMTSATFWSSVISCDTLTHEAVRSDHIVILVDLGTDTKDKTDATKSYRPLKGPKWYEWRERTEADFVDGVQEDKPQESSELCSATSAREQATCI